MIVDCVRAGLPLRAIPSPLAPGNYPQPQGLTWKSSSSRISFRHLIKKAAQTYRWKCENPSGSDCGQKNSGSAPAAQLEHDFPGHRYPTGPPITQLAINVPGPHCFPSLISPAALCCQKTSIPSSTGNGPHNDQPSREGSGSLRTW